MIGCGNILRGDDAVGPVLIRHLHTRGVPEGVRIVDGGTSGMDVAFGMRGAARVVIVDASTTDAPPGTIYRVPAEELAELPPIDGLHTHNFRWNHALSFSAWLLGPLCPTDMTVFLVEAGQLEPGSELSPPVTASMHAVIELLERDFFPAPPSETVTITDSGYLRLDAALAATYFPAHVCVARLHEGSLVVTPLAGAANGGMVLSQRNAAGDRSVLISEVFGFSPVTGTFPVRWDDNLGALQVQLLDPVRPGRPDAHTDGRTSGVRGTDRGGRRGGSVDGLPAGGDTERSGAAASGDLLHRDEGTVGSRRRPADGSATTATEESSR